MLRYAITDRHIFPGGEAARSAALVTQARRLAARCPFAAQSGSQCVLQLREKDLPEPELEALTRRLAEALAEPGGADLTLLLNGPAHVAAAAGAHGVHLRGGATATEVAAVQQVFRNARLASPVFSVSCHSVEEVRRASAMEVDYLLFGPVFEKRVRGRLVAEGLGLHQLRLAAELCRVSGSDPSPRLLALGGVTEANTGACLSAGAAGVAGIRLFA